MISADEVLRARQDYPGLEIREGDLLFVTRRGLTQEGKPVIVTGEDGSFSVRPHVGGAVDGVVAWLYRRLP